MVIEDSDGGGVDVAGTIGGALGVVGGAEDVALGVGTVKGAVEAGGMIFVSILAYRAYGGSRGAGIFGAPRGATWAVK